MTSTRLRSVPVGRVCCFDLENRPLAYWYDGQTTSQITAFGWKWADAAEPETMLLRADGRYELDNGKSLSERKAFERFRDVLTGAALVFGHNIRRHDLPMLQAWLLRLELEPLPRLLTSDTLKDYPRRKDMGASLENLAAVYGLPGRKLGLAQREWERANTLTRDGIMLARDRVKSDVVLQEQLRDRLLGLDLLAAPRPWYP